MEKGGETARGVKTSPPQLVPALVLQNPTVEFVVPVDPKFLPLCIIVGARQVHDWRVSGAGRLLHTLHEPTTGADLDQIAGLGRVFGKDGGF